MSFVTRTNWVIILFTSLAILGYWQLGIGPNHLVWMDLVTFGGVIALQAALLFKLRSLYGFSLVLLYTLALIQGLKIMLSLGSLDSLLAVVSLIIHIFLIFYFIGVRGYLRSNRGRVAMGFSPDADSSQ